MTYRVRVVIVNYRSAGETQDCAYRVTAQLESGDSLVIVNNSPEEELIDLPECSELRSLGSNVGYGAAANHGWDGLDGDVCIVLNPDAKLQPNWIRRVKSILKSDTSIGVLGGKCYYPGTKVFEHAGGFLSAPRFIGAHRGKGEKDLGQYDRFGPVPYIAGSAIAIRNCTELKFDTGFFLYYEDTDVCYRSWRQGMRVCFDPELVAEHPSGSVTNEGSFDWHANFNFSRYRFVIKNLEPWDIAQLIASESALVSDSAATREESALAHSAKRLLSELSDTLAMRAREGGLALPAELRDDLVRMLEDRAKVSGLFSDNVTQ